MEWQPIESAPKDGTMVLVWNGHVIPAECRWEEDWVYAQTCSECRDYLNPRPSHWMPLPAPPEA